MRPRRPLPRSITSYQSPPTVRLLALGRYRAATVGRSEAGSQHGILQRVADVSEGTELVGTEHRRGHRCRDRRPDEVDELLVLLVERATGIGRDGDDRPQFWVADGEGHPRCGSTRFPVLVQ